MNFLAKMVVKLRFWKHIAKWFCRSFFGGIETIPLYGVHWRNPLMVRWMDFDTNGSWLVLLKEVESNFRLRKTVRLVWFRCEWRLDFGKASTCKNCWSDYQSNRLHSLALPAGRSSTLYIGVPSMLLVVGGSASLLWLHYSILFCGCQYVNMTKFQ